jgi:hypothetical protein
MSRHRAQAVVEVLAVAPVVVACVVAFAIAAARLVALARAESALSDALAADVAGTSMRGALQGRARLVSVDANAVLIEVNAPLGAIHLRGERIR